MTASLRWQSCLAATVSRLKGLSIPTITETARPSIPTACNSQKLKSIRVRRLVGVFDAGRILNKKTARSQLMGGMIFGIGGALLEESMMDDRYGSFMNRDFAEYHIAVNPDVPDLEVHMLDGFSQDSNPLGSKGIGELGICGAGPAIANAVYEATGVRVRKFPIHLEDVLHHLPAL